MTSRIDWSTFPPVGATLPAEDRLGSGWRVFTPRVSEHSDARVTMMLDAADLTKVRRGKPWDALVTDQRTGKHWHVRGAECVAGMRCFCDAVIVQPVSSTDNRN